MKHEAEGVAKHEAFKAGGEAQKNVASATPSGSKDEALRATGLEMGGRIQKGGVRERRVVTCGLDGIRIEQPLPPVRSEGEVPLEVRQKTPGHPDEEKNRDDQRANTECNQCGTWFGNLHCPVCNPPVNITMSHCPGRCENCDRPIPEGKVLCDECRDPLGAETPVQPFTVISETAPFTPKDLEAMERRRIESADVGKTKTGLLTANNFSADDDKSAECLELCCEHFAPGVPTCFKPAEYMDIKGTPFCTEHQRKQSHDHGGIYFAISDITVGYVTALRKIAKKETVIHPEPERPPAMSCPECGKPTPRGIMCDDCHAENTSDQKPVYELDREMLQGLGDNIVNLIEETIVSSIIKKFGTTKSLIVTPEMMKDLVCEWENSDPEKDCNARAKFIDVNGKVFCHEHGTHLMMKFAGANLTKIEGMELDNLICMREARQNYESMFHPPENREESPVYYAGKGEMVKIKVLGKTIGFLRIHPDGRSAAFISKAGETI